jgi:PAS domain S-box-containing protein
VNLHSIGKIVTTVEQQLQDAQNELNAFRAAAVQHAIVLITNTSGRITFVNDKFCELSKFSREELLGKDVRIVNSGYHPKEFIRELWTTLSAGRLWQGKFRNRAKTGGSFWVDMTICPQLGPDGKPSQYLALGTDISEYATLRKTSAAFEAVMQTATDHLFFKDRNSRFVRASHALLRHFGVKKIDEIRGKTDLDFFDEEHALAAAQDEKEIVRSGEPMMDKEEKEIHTNGTITWARTSKMPWYDQEGKLIGIMGASRDISDLKQAQKEAADWEARFHFLLNALPIGISWAQITDDGRRRVKLINDEYLRICGVTREQASQWDTFRLITHPDDLPRQDALSFQVAQGKTDHYSMEKRYVRPNGETVWVQFGYRMRNSDDGSFEDLYMAIDLSAYKTQEEQLRMSELLLIATGELSKAGVWIVELPNRAMHWSKDIYAVLGASSDYEPTLEGIIEFHAPECRKAVRQAFETCIREGTPFSLESEVITAKGDRLRVRMLGQSDIVDDHPRCIFGAIQDVTAVKTNGRIA